MKKLLLLLVLASAILANPAHAREREPVVIGALLNLTGDQSLLDLPTSRGAQLAAQNINDGEGILGGGMRLVIADGKSDPAAIAARTKELLKEYPRMAALMGLSDTGMVTAAAEVAAQNKRVFLTSGATSPLLPAQVPTYLYLACFGDNVQGAAGAEYAYKELKSRRVLIAYDEEMEYARLLQGYFSQRFRDMGGEVVETQTFKNHDPSSLTPRVDIDLVYLVAGPEDALAAVKNLRASGIVSPIMGGDSFDSDVWDEDKTIEDVLFTTHAYVGAETTDPVVLAFRNDYFRAFPGTEPDAFAALGYDAVNLLARAIRDSGSSNPEAVREALSEIRSFHGVTGSLSFDEGSRIPRKSVTILEVDHGHLHPLTQVMPTVVPRP